MGVKDLWTILAPVKKHQSITSLKGQTIAVDLSVWVCESVTVKPMQGRVVKPHLRNLFFRVTNLTQLGIKLVFVIDGEAPELKWEEMSRRTQARYGTVNASKKPVQTQHKKGGRSNFKVWLKECQDMLAYLGIPCVQSRGEAEGMCALLNSKEIVDGCLTEDGDAFLYGARTVYKNFTLNTKDPHVDCYSMTDIEQELGLDRHKLVALALLLGCDYLPKGVVGVGKEHGCQLMRQLPSDVNVLHRFNKWAEGKMATESSLGAKPSHCRVCYHAGTGKQHKTQGCNMCGTPIACNKQPRNTKCHCTWHIAQSEMDSTAIERDVMRKAMKTAGFPFKAVISEFLDCHDTCPSTPLHWNRPQLVQLQKYNMIKMEWPEDYTMEKVFPLITLWDLSNIIGRQSKSNTKESLMLESFVKARTRQGVPCIEVQWVRPDWNGTDDNTKLYNSIEREDLLAAAYPDQYQAFIEEKNKKKAKSSAKGKKTLKSNADEKGCTSTQQLPSNNSSDADDELLENIVSSQQLPATISNAVDDEQIDTLVASVMSLQISQNACKGRNVKKDLKTIEEDVTRSKETEPHHPHQQLTSQIETSHRSKASSKSKKKQTEPVTNEKEPPNISGNGKKAKKSSANLTDLNLLEDLLEYEATQSSEKLAHISSSQKWTILTGSKVKRTRDHSMLRYNKNSDPANTNQLEVIAVSSTEKNAERDNADKEILPLFHRIRLKSVKGTTRINKLGSTSDLQQSEHIPVSKSSRQGSNYCDRNSTVNRSNIEREGREKSGSKKVGNHLSNHAIIEIDSDEDNVITEILDKASVLRTEYSIAQTRTMNSDTLKNSKQQICDYASSNDDLTQIHSSNVEDGHVSKQVPKNSAQTDWNITLTPALQDIKRKSKLDVQITTDGITTSPTTNGCRTLAPNGFSLKCIEKTPERTVTDQSTDLMVSTAMEDAELKSSHVYSPFTMVADETVAADYRLIQPNVTGTPTHNVKMMAGDLVAMTTPSANHSSTMSANIASLHCGKTVTLSATPTSAIVKASSSNSISTKTLTSCLATPTCASADITASSNNSYWCDDSQMSLFDSPSFVHLDLLPRFTATDDTSAANVSRSIATGSCCTINHSTVPYVIDADTPDIPEEVVHTSYGQMPSESCSNILSKEYCEKDSTMKENAILNVNYLSKDTPKLAPKHGNPPQIQKEHVTANYCNYEGRVASYNSEATHRNSYARENTKTSEDSVYFANMTCVPVAINCNTPDMSIVMTYATSKDTMNQDKAYANSSEQVTMGTPHHGKHQMKPHTLRLNQEINGLCIPNNPETCTEPTITRIAHNRQIDGAGILECDSGAYQGHKEHTAMIGGHSDGGISVGITDRQEIPKVKTTQKYDDKVENSPVCLLDRLRRKFDHGKDIEATLSALAVRPKPK